MDRAAGRFYLGVLRAFSPRYQSFPQRPLVNSACVEHPGDLPSRIHRDVASNDRQRCREQCSLSGVLASGGPVVSKAP